MKFNEAMKWLAVFIVAGIITEVAVAKYLEFEKTLVNATAGSPNQNQTLVI